MSNKHNGIPSGSSPLDALNLGHGNFLVSGRIVAILEPGSLPMKRLREKACEQNMLIDATAGRKTRSILVTDSKHVILSALAPQTLHDRLSGPSSGRGSISAAMLEIEHGEFVS